MRKLTITQFIIFIALASFSSCATIFNQPQQRVFIAANSKIKSVEIPASLSIDSTLKRIDAPKIYSIERSPRPLIIHLKLDSSEKTIILKSHNSFEYWANIYFNLGLGMLVDRDNTKRYAYPSRNYFSVKDTSIIRSSFAPIRKGTMNLSLSWPIPSFYDLHSDHGNYTSVGALAIQTGIDYFFKNNQYFSLNFGIGNDAFGEHFGTGYLEFGSIFFTNVMNNHVTGSFDLGYGINLSKFEWRRTTIGDTINLDNSIKNTALGVSLSAQYRFGNYFRLGILYQPDFYSPDLLPAFIYQHYISLNLVWKLPLKNAIKN